MNTWQRRALAVGAALVCVFLAAAVYWPVYEATPADFLESEESSWQIESLDSCRIPPVGRPWLLARKYTIELDCPSPTVGFVTLFRTWLGWTFHSFGIGIEHPERERVS